MPIELFIILSWMVALFLQGPKFQFIGFWIAWLIYLKYGESLLEVETKSRIRDKTFEGSIALYIFQIIIGYLITKISSIILAVIEAFKL